MWPVCFRRGDPLRAAAWPRSPRRSLSLVISGGPAEAFRRRVPALCVEAALLGGGGRLRRAAGTADPRRLPQLLQDALRREVAVAQLRALVLRDRTHHRPQAFEDTPDLRRCQPGGGLDVEKRLDAGRGLLRVRPPPPARTCEPERDSWSHRLGLPGRNLP